MGPRCVHRGDPGRTRLEAVRAETGARRRTRLARPGRISSGRVGSSAIRDSSLRCRACNGIRSRYRVGWTVDLWGMTSLIPVLRLRSSPVDRRRRCGTRAPRPHCRRFTRSGGGPLPWRAPSVRAPPSSRGRPFAERPAWPPACGRSLVATARGSGLGTAHGGRGRRLSVRLCGVGWFLGLQEAPRLHRHGLVVVCRGRCAVAVAERLLSAAL